MGKGYMEKTEKCLIHSSVFKNIFYNMCCRYTGDDFTSSSNNPKLSSSHYLIIFLYINIYMYMRV